MSQEIKKYKYGTLSAEVVIRNCRIVWLHNSDSRKYTFTRLAQMFGMTKQNAQRIYADWSTRPEPKYLFVEGYTPIHL